MASSVLSLAAYAGHHHHGTVSHHRQGHHQSHHRHSVTVYYTPYCPVCHQIMGELRSIGQPFRSVDVEGTNFGMVPVTVIDGHSYVGGMSVGQLEHLLS